ncbi:hypothetical protein PR048_021613 [Dryococelus australis]|uniref:Reverse transcriptase domain-containing protein n=1 Tax=Dryococelus australis TaxID=614101 RepID=A0ABQ9GYQ4_9NEOP|nr:hypothetical protein PR048_021613 [Dryococelus australis]
MFKRKLTGYKPPSLCFRRKDGTLATTNEENCEILANYLRNLLTGEKPIDPIKTEQPIFTYLESLPPDKDEIKRHIARLKNNKALGEDSVIAELWKYASEESIEILQKQIQEICNEETLSKDWKTALIHLLYKEVSMKLLAIIRSTLTDTKSKVKFLGCLSDSFEIKTGVRQVDRLLPLLFNCLLEKIIRTWQMKLKEINYGPIRMGTKFKGIAVDTVAFADDIAILSNDVETARIQIELLKEISRIRHYKKVLKPAVLYAAETLFLNTDKGLLGELEKKERKIIKRNPGFQL